ncbi:MAG: GNAT family N-acetyltransferase [Anaerolineae bacterium]
MITIRKANLEDIPQIRAVGSASWRATYTGIFPDEFIENALAQWWSEAIFQQSIPHSAACNLVAELDGHIVGTLLGTVNPGEEAQVHLFKLYIHPDYFGQGIGKQLWQTYLQHLAPGVKRVDLDVEPQNARAIQFYKRLSFQETGINEVEAFGYTMKTMLMSLNLQGGQAAKTTLP